MKPTVVICGKCGVAMPAGGIADHWRECVGLPYACPGCRALIRQASDPCGCFHPVHLATLADLFIRGLR